MSVKTRLKALEKKAKGREPTIIVSRYVGVNGSLIPVDRFKSSTGQILDRKPGESDDELIERAVADKNGSVVVLEPYNGHAMHTSQK